MRRRVRSHVVDLVEPSALERRLHVSDRKLARLRFRDRRVQMVRERFLLRIVRHVAVERDHTAGTEDRKPRKAQLAGAVELLAKRGLLVRKRALLYQRPNVLGDRKGPPR